MTKTTHTKRFPSYEEAQAYVHKRWPDRIAMPPSLRYDGIGIGAIDVVWEE